MRYGNRTAWWIRELQKHSPPPSSVWLVSPQPVSWGGHRASRLQRGDTAIGQRGASLGAEAGSVPRSVQEHHSLPCRRVTGTPTPLPALQCLFFLTSGPVCMPARREGSGGKVPPPQHSSQSPRTHTSLQHTMKHQDPTLPPAQIPCPRASPPSPSLHIFNCLGCSSRNAAIPPLPPSSFHPSPSCSFQHLPEIPLQGSSHSACINSSHIHSPSSPSSATKTQHMVGQSVCPLHCLGTLGSASHPTDSTTPLQGNNPVFAALPLPSLTPQLSSQQCQGN